MQRWIIYILEQWHAKVTQINRKTWLLREKWKITHEGTRYSKRVEIRKCMEEKTESGFYVESIKIHLHCMTFFLDNRIRHRKSSKKTTLRRIHFPLSSAIGLIKKSCLCWEKDQNSFLLSITILQNVLKQILGIYVNNFLLQQQKTRMFDFYCACGIIILVLWSNINIVLLVKTNSPWILTVIVGMMLILREYVQKLFIW